jgi:hypothetical protein
MAKLTTAGNENLAEAIRRRFASFGGVELDLPKRDPIRPAPFQGDDAPNSNKPPETS